MRKLYHYTSLESLMGIIGNNKLSFWAKHYSHYKNGEYIWIKKEANKVIDEICLERNCNNTLEEDEINPCIICFCRNGKSKYMWEHYAQKQVILELDYDYILRNTINPAHQTTTDCYGNVCQISYIDDLIKCSYIRKRNPKRIIKRQLTSGLIYKNYNINLRSDLTMISTSLKSKHFKNEKEIRYVRAYPIIAEFDEKGNEIPIDIPSSSPQNAQVHDFVDIEKDALISIVIGEEISSSYDIIRNHLDLNGFNNVNIVIK